MADTTFSIRIKGLDELIANAKRAGPLFQMELRSAMRDATLLVHKNARDQRAGRFKQRTGNLRRNIRFSVFGAQKGIVFVSEAYGEYVEFGTRPHIILPRRKRMLKFVVGGSVVFARKVNHPGSKPYPFMAPAFEESQPKISRLYDLIGDAIVKELAK